jgi:hypothetical protein
MKLNVKVRGSKRNVECIDEDCPKRKCWHPHDCPVQGQGGIRESTPRWMCLTNVLKGCPDNFKDK